MNERVCVVYHDMLTAYGHGVSCCTDALFKRQTNFTQSEYFAEGTDSSTRVAYFPQDLFASRNNIAESAVMYLLNNIPKIFSVSDLPFFFALTQGEICKLENAQGSWTASLLVRKVAEQVAINEKSRIFSASCASGNVALARAAAEIASGKMEQIWVVGCETVSEFTFSGFASIHALTSDECRPYDASHNGLLLGDAAGIMLLVSEKLAIERNWQILATIDGFGITTDSYHAAAPDPNGIQMAVAINNALSGDIPCKTAGVIGHGTGTELNDNMEIAALNRVFPDGLPLASIKGGTGHILAASGIIQTSCAIDCLQKGMLFPQTSLQKAQNGAEKFVSHRSQFLHGDAILVLNAGFGGLNAVLRVGRY